ncbi:5136_t:CDS:2, partial [Scutellospora calospora]
MIPDQTLATKLVKGKKKIKDKITVLLYMNTTGTDKLKLLVIGKSTNPYCFKGIRRENLDVKYDSSKKAWMTEAIFERWIKSLNNACRLNRKKILLLVDGATSHSNCELTNVKLHFLPPNTTPYLQPYAINCGQEIPKINLLSTI